MRTLLAVVACTSALALAACGHEGKRLSDDSENVGQPHASAPEPASPHDVGANPNPHAGMQMPAQPQAQPAPEPSVAWTAPAGWAEHRSTRPLRYAEFDVGKFENGAPVQLVVYTGITGGDRDNLDRWTKQMGEGAEATAKTEHVDHDGLKITRLEVRGTYADTMGMSGGPPTIEDATMLAAIVETKDGSRVHVKLVCPPDLAADAKPKFDAFLASIKAR